MFFSPFIYVFFNFFQKYGIVFSVRVFCLIDLIYSRVLGIYYDTFCWKLGIWKSSLLSVALCWGQSVRWWARGPLRLRTSPRWKLQVSSGLLWARVLPRTACGFPVSLIPVALTSLQNLRWSVNVSTRALLFPVWRLLVWGPPAAFLSQDASSQVKTLQISSVLLPPVREGMATCFACSRKARPCSKARGAWQREPLGPSCRFTCLFLDRVLACFLLIITQNSYKASSVNS